MTINKMVEIGASWDWVIPVYIWIQNYRKRPATGFNADFLCGYYHFEINRMLREKGIESWGYMRIDNLLVFSVRMAQAKYTSDLLLKWGINHTHGKINERAIRKDKQRRQRREERRTRDRSNQRTRRIARRTNSRTAPRVQFR